MRNNEGMTEMELLKALILGLEAVVVVLAAISDSKDE